MKFTAWAHGCGWNDTAEDSVDYMAEILEDIRTGEYQTADEIMNDHSYYVAEFIPAEINTIRQAFAIRHKKLEEIRRHTAEIEADLWYELDMIFQQIA